MSEKKLRVYVISLMAFAPLNDTTHPGESTYVEHFPALVPAESIEMAAEEAKKVAFNRWKTFDGWHSHQVAIQPVTHDFYEAAFAAHTDGVVDFEKELESPRTFQF